MNARERVLAALAHKSTDRVPMFAHIRSRELVQHVTGRNVDESPLELTALTHQRLGVDLCALLWFTRQGVTVGDGRSSLLGFKTQHDGYESWVIERPFTTLEQAVAWRPVFAPDTLQAEAVDNVIEHQRLIGQSGVCIGRSRGFLLSTYMSLGWENIGIMMMEHEQALVEIMAAFAARIKDMAPLLAEKAPQTPAFLYVADIAGNRGPLFSPVWLRKHYFPLLRSVVQAFTSRGITFIYHCDGNVMPILDDLMACGIDALHPLDPMGGMSLQDVRRRCDDKLVLLGNCNMEPYWTPSDVAREVHRCVDEGGPGYFLTPATGTEGAPLANLLTFFDVANRFRS